MGIETALIALGASATTAAAVSAGAAALGTIGAAKALTQKPKAPTINMPTPEKPPAAGQAAKSADHGAAVAANAAAAGPGGAMAGNRGTFLTGPDGVEPESLKLGKNTLLGQ
jgi:hypothetical protein